jgi:Chaperone of endosialidase
MKNQSATYATTFLALAWFSFLPQIHAVAPPPDGCSPNFTTAEGCDALSLLTTGAGNTGLGWRALFLDSSGNFNTGVGVGALALNNADSNTAVGAAALLLNTGGTENTAVGTGVLVHNDTGNSNDGVGAFALSNNTAGNFNTAIGGQALNNNTTGHHNAAIGNGALIANTTGNANVAIGAGAGGGVVTADNVICIGTAVFGNNVSGTCFIGNIRNVTTQNANAIPVLIDAAGQLGTASSSARFKTDIKCMNNASEAILALKPVTFHYKSDTSSTPQFGLIAEEVANVNPDLVVRDGNGEIYTVRYDAVNAMLLNEFLKDHRKVEEQQAAINELKSVAQQQHKEFQAAIAEQRKQFEAHLKQQDARIQRINNQLELQNSTTRTVVNNE